MRSCTRRTLLRTTLGGLAAYGLAGRKTSAQAPAPPSETTKPKAIPASALAKLHEQIAQILKDHRIVGGSVAIFHHGDVIFDHGYGLANLATSKPVAPQTLFSLASVSKSLTGIGFLRLVQDGKVNLDARMVEVLDGLRPFPGQRIVDPRIRTITAHQLLFHGGGFIHDAPEPSAPRRGEAYDRLDCENRYRMLLTKPLLCDPGTESHYSNAGFMVVRLMIEAVTGQEYETFMREQILKPMGIVRLRCEHGTEPLPDESHRYLADHRPADRILGNWLAPAAGIARFAAAVAGSGGRAPYLSAAIDTEMFAMPATLKVQRPQGPHVGLGWDTVRTFPDGRHRFSKNGGKPGVQSWLEHLEYDVDWSALLNTNTPEKDKTKPIGQIRQLVLAMFGGDPDPSDE